MTFLVPYHCPGSGELKPGSCCTPAAMLMAAAVVSVLLLSAAPAFHLSISCFAVSAAACRTCWGALRAWSMRYPPT